MPPRFNIPPLTRALLLTTIFQTVVYASLKYKLWISSTSSTATARPDNIQAIPYLTLVPGPSLFFPWVFVTATFVEGNIFTLVVALNAVFYGGKYLERAWGSREFGKFVGVVTVVPNFWTMAIVWTWYVMGGETDKL